MGLFTDSIIEIPKRRINTYSDWTDSSKDKEPQPINYETFYKAYKQSPEFLSVIESVVTDVVSDGGTITDDGSNKASDKDIEDMKNHLLKINWIKKIKKWVRHGCLTGDGYMEYHILNLDTYKSIASKIYKQVYGFTLNKSNTFSYKTFEKAIRRRREKGKVDGFPFNVYPIKTTGMNKQVDNNGKVIGYVQSVNAGKVYFSPDEIINWMPIDIDEVYGMTPAQSVSDDIATLLFAKQYAGKFFENGGVPNIIFILEKARGMNDRNYEVAKQEIRNSRKRKNWQKTMVLTGGGGGIKIEKLNDFKKDMEFLNLINMCLRNIAMAFGVPPSKVPYNMETKGDLKEMNEGYYKDINEFQNQIESIVNNKIFKFYNMRWRFNRSYKIDELREANIVTLLRDRALITEKEARERIGYFNEKDVEDSLPSYPARDIKHRDTGNAQESRGTGPDYGAKLTRSNIPLLTKSNDDIEVSFEDFNNILEGLGMNINNAKVFYKEYSDRFELFFNDLTGSYKCVVVKANLDNVDFFRESNLVNCIRRE